jgi:hypothetical protein
VEAYRRSELRKWQYVRDRYWQEAVVQVSEMQAKTKTKKANEKSKRKHSEI